MHIRIISILLISLSLSGCGDQLPPKYRQALQDITQGLYLDWLSRFDKPMPRKADWALINEILHYGSNPSHEWQRFWIMLHQSGLENTGETNGGDTGTAEGIIPGNPSETPEGDDTSALPTTTSTCYKPCAHKLATNSSTPEL